MTTILNSSYLNNPVTVAEGGSGVATNTIAYGLLAAGTTATAPIQNAGTGASGQIYVSGGAAALGSWTNANAVGTWQLLSTQVASNSATINFTGLTTAYEIYKIMISDVIPASSGSFRMRVSSNNGSSYDAGATDYFNSLSAYDENNVFTVQNNNAASIRLDHTSLSSTSQGNSWEITLVEPAVSLNNNGPFWICRYLDSTGTFQKVVSGQGRRAATQVNNAVQFFVGAGNLTSGTFNLYGVLT